MRIMEELAPGVRFYPTEEELVSFYLHHKLEGKREDLNRVVDRIIPVVDIYKFSPCQLPQKAGIYNHKDPEQWFFFIPRQESEARGGRPKRLTDDGYWKATGSPGFVFSANNRFIAVRRTMVFYTGRAPHGRKTEWKMNEYKAIQEQAPSSPLANPKVRQEFSLSRVYRTKCIRSFDRRPSGVEIRQMRSEQPRLHGEEEVRPNHAMVEETIISLEGDGTLQGGHFFHHQSGGEAIVPMVTDNDSFWDLEPLANFFFSGEDI